MLLTITSKIESLLFGQLTFSLGVFFLHLSVVKIKVPDASVPPGLPTLLAAAGTTSEKVVASAISALSFSPDGEV